MADESFPQTDDPEILALLDFAPVERRNKRNDGWSPEHQRGYIVGLALTGNVDKAAHMVDRTQSGAWTVRNSAGAEGFGKAWDDAVALYRRRNPRRGPPPPLQVPARRATMAAERAAAAAGLSQAEEEAEHAALGEALLNMYWVKVKAERRCRLEGRIVDADFYVRQLTAIEIACDLSEHGGKLLAELKRGGVGYLDVEATPISLYFDYLRRSHWAERGEAERPDLPRLHEIRDGVAAAPPDHYIGNREGIPYADWRAQRQIAAADAAKAQALWEEKARRDSAEWRARVERAGNSSPAFAGEGDHPKDGGGAADGEAERAAAASGAGLATEPEP